MRKIASRQLSQSRTEMIKQTLTLVVDFYVVDNEFGFIPIHKSLLVTDGGRYSFSKGVERISIVLCQLRRGTRSLSESGRRPLWDTVQLDSYPDLER